MNHCSTTLPSTVTSKEGKVYVKRTNAIENTSFNQQRLPQPNNGKTGNHIINTAQRTIQPKRYKANQTIYRSKDHFKQPQTNLPTSQNSNQYKREAIVINLYVER